MIPPTPKANDRASRETTHRRPPTTEFDLLTTTHANDDAALELATALVDVLSHALGQRHEELQAVLDEAPHRNPVPMGLEDLLRAYDVVPAAA